MPEAIFFFFSHSGPFFRIHLEIGFLFPGRHSGLDPESSGFAVTPLQARHSLPLTDIFVFFFFLVLFPGMLGIFCHVLVTFLSR